VVSESAGTILEKLIVDWVGTLPAGVVRWTVEEAPMERVVWIDPIRVGAASVVLRIADYGGCGVYAGEGLMIEEIRDAPGTIIQMCEGVRDGLLRERVWRWRNKSVIVHSDLELPSGHWRTFVVRWWLLPLLPRKQEVQYRPWM